MGRATVVLSGVLVVFGFAIVARTAAAGVGGGFGFLVGACFVAAGALRLYLLRAAASADLHPFRSTGRFRRITGRARDPGSGHRKRRPRRS